MSDMGSTYTDCHAASRHGLGMANDVTHTLVNPSGTSTNGSALSKGEKNRCTINTMSDMLISLSCVTRHQQAGVTLH